MITFSLDSKKNLLYLHLIFFYTYPGSLLSQPPSLEHLLELTRHRFYTSDTRPEGGLPHCRRTGLDLISIFAAD